MAYASKNLGKISVYSSYTAYTNEAGTHSTGTPSTGEETRYISFADLGIVAGSTVDSASITWSWGAGGNLHGTSIQGITFNGTAYTGGSSYSGMAVSAGSSNTLIFRYKSGTSNTSYPSPPGSQGTNSKTNAGYLYFENATLHVYYTLPYSAVNPPTAVSTPTNVRPSTNHTLSWSGASGGSNTSVASYQVYRLGTGEGSYTAIGSATTASSMTVTSHSTIGYSYYYKVLSNSNPAGYNSGLSSATATLTTTVSAVGAPSLVSSPNNVLPDTDQTLSWTAGSAGTNNGVASYQVYRSTVYNSGYAAYGSATTSLSMTVRSHTSVGSTYYYKVASNGEYSGYGSAMSASYATLTSTITNVSTPTTPAISPTNYEATATFNWNASTAGTNNEVSSYVIEYSTSTDNTLWSAGTTLTSSTNSKELNTSAIARGTYLRFRVYAIGTHNGYDSGWSTYSASVKKNQLPLAPTIVYGVNGKTTYNTQPYFKIVVSAEPDGQTQEIQLSVNGGGYTPIKSEIPAAGGTFAFRLPTLAVGAHSLLFKVVDSVGASSPATNTTLTVATPAFTDNTLTGIAVKAIHINELRTQINNLRQFYGMAAVSWIDTITAGNTVVKAAHFTQLQTALSEIASLVGVSLTLTAVAKNQRVSASTLPQLRDAIPFM